MCVLLFPLEVRGMLRHRKAGPIEMCVDTALIEPGTVCVHLNCFYHVWIPSGKPSPKILHTTAACMKGVEASTRLKLSFLQDQH